MIWWGSGLVITCIHVACDHGIVIVSPAKLKLQTHSVIKSCAVCVKHLIWVTSIVVLVKCLVEV